MSRHHDDLGVPVADFHEFEMDSITGEPVAFSDYEGKVCLVVNVATY
jgi:glutathione peroxidase-family protein